MRMVTPLVLFVLGLATVLVTIFLGVVQAAFSLLMRLSLRLMAERGGRSDRLGHYLDDPPGLFLPIRLLLGLSTVLAGALIASLSDINNAVSVVTFVVSLVAFVLVCEHIVPMLIARLGPERVLDVTLPVFHPIARVVHPLAAALLELGGGRRERERENANGNGTETAERAVADATERTDRAISDEEGRELLQSVVDFTETVVREVMTPRPDIVAVRAESSLTALRATFREEQYSRMPVYRDDLDNIVGVVYVKDLVSVPPDAEPPITTLMRPPFMVPESKRVSELLKEMQRRQVQMAIVVDEYGGTAGLVTVEDLLEEIVGEIRDEYDVESDTVTDEGQGVFVFNGKVSVDEVGERLGVDIAREGFETVGGYVLSHLGRMPYVGEPVEIGDLALDVLEVQRRRITKVRARRRQTSPGLSAH